MYISICTCVYVYMYVCMYTYILRVRVCVLAPVCLCNKMCCPRATVPLNFLFLAQVLLTLFTSIPEPTFVNQFLNDVCCCALALWAMTSLHWPVLVARGGRSSVISRSTVTGRMEVSRSTAKNAFFGWAWGSPSAAASRSVPLASSNAAAASQAVPLL